jgi:hypothetical protein
MMKSREATAGSERVGDFTKRLIALDIVSCVITWALVFLNGAPPLLIFVSGLWAASAINLMVSAINVASIGASWCDTWTKIIGEVKE